jgi:hypothetical protein
MSNLQRIALMLAVWTLTACASSVAYQSKTAAPAPQPALVERPLPRCVPEDVPRECDRRAILAMQGTYKVSFAFDETVVLASGYTRHAPQRSGGHEWVFAIEDTPEKISLQHVLVGDGGHVTKHWRQDWYYEMPAHWVFEGAQHFGPSQRAPEAVPGTWTQLVYDVHDAPRYAGSGKWNHKYGVSTWTSERTWRPLPRREYTKRTDYQLINAENRHTITPQGWTHEQDNTKVVRHADGEHSLVREFGFNDYRLENDYDYSPAREYWARTGEYWAAVRARWAQALSQQTGLTLNYAMNDEAFIGALFELADMADGQPSTDRSARIAALFDQFVDSSALSEVGAP